MVAMENRLPLRILAAVGFVTMLLEGEFGVGGPRPDSEFVYGLLAIAAGSAMLLGPARAGFARLRRHWDLLVPYGCYKAAWFALSSLPIAPMAINLSNPFAHFTILGFAILIAGLFLEVALILWTTSLIIQAVTRDVCAPWTALQAVPPCLLRGAGLLFIAMFALMAPLVIALRIAPGAIVAVLIGLSIYGVVLNLATVAWFPLASRVEIPFVEAIRRSSQTCWRLKQEWGLLIGCWMVALGYFALYSFRIAKPGGSTSSTNWNVDLGWLGAFPSKCRWYSGLCEAAKVPTESAVAIPITVLFVAVTISAKFVLIDRLAAIGLFSSPTRSDDVADRLDP